MSEDFRISPESCSLGLGYLNFTDKEGTLGLYAQTFQPNYSTCAFGCSFIVRSTVIAALSSTALSRERRYIKESEQRDPLKAAFSANFENVKKHPVPMSALKWPNSDNVAHTYTVYNGIHTCIHSPSPM